jgi:hypothetical protein
MVSPICLPRPFHNSCCQTVRWAGSGFKLVASGLNSLILQLGNHTTTPQAAVAISVDYAEFITINVTAGKNVIPIPAIPASEQKKNRVVRMNVEGWQNNRIHLEKIELNAVIMVDIACITKV